VQLSADGRQISIVDTLRRESRLAVLTKVRGAPRAARACAHVSLRTMRSRSSLVLALSRSLAS
jgi:hypothetical protein